MMCIAAVGGTLLLSTAQNALADGNGENVLLVINPMDKDSLLIGNYYRLRRQIPERNVLYLVPASADYQTFAAENVNALLGTLANRQLDDHIDYVVVTPGNGSTVSAANLVNDSCSPVTKFATPSGFTMAYITDSILAGGNFSTRTNRYATGTNVPMAFDSNIKWFGGVPSDRPEAERYFIGAMLGYTGNRGNTVTEVLDMIDRSIAADGTHPVGTFYFMKTNDAARSGPRDPIYPLVVSEIIAMGGQAYTGCCDPLPIGAPDVMGLMTGLDVLDIPGAGMTILPGAFCDHLTSFAGTFSNNSQTKMSEWIANGASGTAGTVEEPCNYPGKFPSPRIHEFYFQGLTLGESVFRSLAYIPFQTLIMGDPLTQPFTYIPVVDVVDAPTQPVSGIITLTPSATTDHPTARIDHYELLIDGVTRLSVNFGRTFSLDTTRLADGWHDMRVLAFDDSNVKSVGRWLGDLMIDNHGLSATIQCNRGSGNYDSPYDFTVDGAGGAIAEYRVVQSGRVLGATTSPQTAVRIYGATLGAGDVNVQGEVLFADGTLVRSMPLTEIVNDNPGSPQAIPPVAYGFTKHVLKGQPCLLELPGSFNQFTSNLGYQVVTPPSQSTILSTTTGPYRVIEPDANATGTDQLTFKWTHPNGASSQATITLVYDDCIFGDLQLAVGTLNGGQQGHFNVTCAYPNEQTYLVYSTAGLGNVFVGQLNVTLGLRSPIQAGNAKRSDANGNVTWNLPIPNVHSRDVWFQAAQRSAVSNVVQTRVN